MNKKKPLDIFEKFRNPAQIGVPSFNPEADYNKQLLHIMDPENTLGFYGGIQEKSILSQLQNSSQKEQKQKEEIVTSETTTVAPREDITLEKDVEEEPLHKSFLKTIAHIDRQTTPQELQELADIFEKVFWDIAPEERAGVQKKLMSIFTGALMDVRRELYERHSMDNMYVVIENLKHWQKNIKITQEFFTLCDTLLGSADRTHPLYSKVVLGVLELTNIKGVPLKKIPSVRSVVERLNEQLEVKDLGLFLYHYIFAGGISPRVIRSHGKRALSIKEDADAVDLVWALYALVFCGAFGKPMFEKEVRLICDRLEKEQQMLDDRTLSYVVRLSTYFGVSLPSGLSSQYDTLVSKRKENRLSVFESDVRFRVQQLLLYCPNVQMMENMMVAGCEMDIPLLVRGKNGELLKKIDLECDGNRFHLNGLKSEWRDRLLYAIDGWKTVRLTTDVYYNTDQCIEFFEQLKRELS